MTNNNKRKPMYKIEDFTKEQLVEVITSSLTMAHAAESLGTNRRTLLRLREKFNIVDLAANSANLPKSKRKNGVPYKKMAIQELCESLGISFKEIKKLKAKKEKQEQLEAEKKLIEEEQNKNLTKTYDGSFKEKSDITLKEYKKFVITSVQNNTEIDEVFYETLKSYCKINNAKLLVVPVYYNFNKETGYFKVPHDEMFFNNIQLSTNLKLMSSLRILPTITDPFAGVDSLSKGDSIIIPHPQVAMKTMATLGKYKAQMHTTGSISLKEGAYARTKTGYKAEFNHSIAALVVELGEGDSFHIRGLNSDSDSGFYDISGYYHGDSVSPIEYVEAIYLGDTHVGVIDPNVVNATWRNDDSMVKVLKPKVMIHGDILDFSSQSHHDSHDYVLRAAKAQHGLNSVEDELVGVATFLRSSRVPGVKNIIVSSNHNEHLYKWTTSCDPKNDVNNAKLYHKLNYMMLEESEKTSIGVSIPNVLKLYYENSPYKDILEYCEFSNRTDGYRIMDIEISMHGDKGANGSRGSVKGFSRLPTKTIVGHSHTPNIDKGCYMVGTSSMLNLSYNSGPSSWMHAHCVIYPNGKRQMINIIDGKWHA